LQNSYDTQIFLNPSFITSDINSTHVSNASNFPSIKNFLDPHYGRLRAVVSHFAMSGVLFKDSAGAIPPYRQQRPFVLRSSLLDQPHRKSRDHAEVVLFPRSSLGWSMRAILFPSLPDWCSTVRIRPKYSIFVLIP
jgi:hypothetical protein